MRPKFPWKEDYKRIQSISEVLPIGLELPDYGVAKEKPTFLFSWFLFHFSREFSHPGFCKATFAVTPIVTTEYPPPTDVFQHQCHTII